MRQFTAVVLEREIRTVFDALAESAVVQFRRMPEGPDTAPLPAPDHEAERARCDDLVRRVEGLRASLENLAPPQKALAPPKLTVAEAEAELAVIEKEADAMLTRRERLLGRCGEVSALCRQVSAYRGMDVPLESPDRYSFLHFVIGSLPAEGFERLQHETGAEAALLPLTTGEERLALVALTTRRGRIALESALEKVGFQGEELPVIHGGTVDTVCEASAREESSLKTALHDANKKVQSFAQKTAPALERIAQAATVERQLLEAERHFPRTETAVLLAGWVPADQEAALEQRLRMVTGGRCVMQTKMPAQTSPEEVPVLLRHPRLLRPFETLVTAYGFPGYQELEPTVFVALSYVLMFGMMFGDTGHGAVLTAAGIAALLVGRARQIRDFGVLLLFGGVSSAIFGVLYGSYFGLPELKPYALWHDPLEGDPMALMYTAIEFGVVMISLGLILNILNRLRRGEVLGAFLEPVINFYERGIGA